MKVVFPLLGICLFIMTACEKEDLAPKLRREAEEKIMGKWMVELTINEEYDPLPTLKSITRENPTTDDYLDFKTAMIVEVSSTLTGNKDEIYKVWNPYQVMIGDISWRIEKLTTTELVLIWDRNDAAQYKRFVTKIYLKR